MVFKPRQVLKTAVRIVKFKEILVINIMIVRVYWVFQKFVPIVNCILSRAFNTSLGKCKLIQVRNLSNNRSKQFQIKI